MVGQVTVQKGKNKSDRKDVHATGSNMKMQTKNKINKYHNGTQWA
jgi:hypothetical protein